MYNGSRRLIPGSSNWYTDDVISGQVAVWLCWLRNFTASPDLAVQSDDGNGPLEAKPWAPGPLMMDSLMTFNLAFRTTLWSPATETFKAQFKEIL
ncbi:hypothetical protein H920_16581 [Fukomys damarensis]|uniref:Uncharacterized protein n=1 Tax=Fukomys damarensis TaxID=885580 RepID=A0A091CVD0_FUKDA|nr:hypothetical protein H920_16581 [Fukomys damarensis]